MLAEVAGSWRVVELLTPDGLIAAEPDTALFDLADGTVRGTTGVNHVEGAYETHGSSLRFGPIRTTRMAGPDVLMRQEAALLSALSAVRRWSDDDGVMTLMDGDGVVLVRVAPSVEALRPGTAWRVADVRLDPDTVAPTDAEHPPTLSFGDDGRVTGSLGLNRFSGAYALEGDALSFGVLASTRVMPAPPLDVQEAAVTTALGLVTSARVESGRLVLRDGRGRGVIWAFRTRSGQDPH